MKIKLFGIGLALLACFFLRGLFVLVGLMTWGWFHGIELTASPWNWIGLHRLEFHHVTLRNIRGEVFFTGEKIHITYHPRVLFHHGIQASLEQIELENPTFFFHRYSNGQWSTSLLRFKPILPRALRARLSLNNGEIAIADEVWTNDHASLISFRKVNGFLDFSDPIAVNVHLNGLCVPAGTIQAQGKLLFPFLLGNIHFSGAHISLATLGNYFLHQSTVRLESGEGTGQLNVVLTGAHPLLFSGYADVDHAALTFPQWGGFQITDGQTHLIINTELIQFKKITGLLHRSPVTGEGIVLLPNSPSKSFLFALNSHMKSFSIARTRIKTLNLLALFSRDKGLIDKATVLFDQGRLKINGGWRNHDNPLIIARVQGSVAGMPLDTAITGTLHLQSPADQWGAIHWIDPKFSGSGIVHFKPHQDPVLFAGGETGSLSFKHILFQPGRWSIAFIQNQGNYLFASPDATVTGSFTSKKHFDASFVAAAPLKPFHAIAAGEWKQPALDFSTVALGSLRKKPLSLKGDFLIQPASIDFPSVQAVWATGLYDFAGDFSRLAGGPIHLRGTIAQSDLADLLALNPRLSKIQNALSGKISGAFQVAGTSKNPSGRFHAYVHHGQLLGETISTAYAEGAIQQNKIYLNPLAVRYHENYLTAKGTVDLNGQTNLQVNVPQLSLEEIEPLQNRFGLLRGKIIMHGKITGSLTSPDLSGNLQASGFQWNRLNLDKIQLQGAYQGKSVSFSHVDILRKSGRLTGHGTVDFGATPALDIHLDLSKARLADLFALPQLSPFGPLNGHVALSGEFPSFNGDFDLSLEKTGEISGDVSGKVRGAGLLFSSLQLLIGNGKISGIGNWRFDRPLQIFMQGDNLDLAYVRQIFQLPGIWGGIASFHGQVDAAWLHPEMALTVSLSRPYLQSLSADNFTGKLHYKNGKFSLADGQLEKGNEKLQVSGGLLPLALDLQLTNQSLGLITGYFPGIQGNGLANAQVHISGEPGNLVFSGEGEINGGTLKVPGLSNSIEQALIIFHMIQNQLEFEISGLLGKPFHGDASFQLNGADLSNILGDGEISISGSDLSLAIPNLAQIVTTANITLKKNNAHWSLNGDALIESGAIDLEGLTANNLNYAIPISADMALNTSITLTQPVHLLHPRFDASGLEGTLSIGGTVSAPEFKGEIVAVKGTLDLFGEPYKIIYGRAVFSPGERLPYLTLSAKSVRRISGSRILLSLRGRPGNFQVSLNADPPLAPNVLSMNINQQQQVDQLFSVYPGPAFLSPFGQPTGTYYTAPGTGSALNLSNISLDVLPGGELAIKLQKELTPRLSITYSRPLAYSQVQRPGIDEVAWGFEYEIRPSLVMQITQDNLNGFGGELVSRWSFF